MFKRWLLALLIGAPGVAQAAPRKWVIRGAYSAAHFEAQHLLVARVRGSFAQVRGDAIIDEDDLTRSQVKASIAVASLYSGSAERDAWLLGGDFLAAQRFPTMRFVSTSVARSPEGKLLMTGALEVRGVSRVVVFEVSEPSPPQTDALGRELRAVRAHTIIDRKDFGMRWQENLPGGGVLLGDEIRIELDIELVATRG